MDTYVRVELIACSIEAQNERARKVRVRRWDHTRVVRPRAYTRGGSRVIQYQCGIR